MGAYSVTNPRLSNTIAGVAIATAIIPPLAACGLCLADGRLSQALGAFVLFGTNFLAIQFAAAVIFLLAGLEGRQNDSKLRQTLLRAFGPAAVLLIVLGVC